jgi:uncharacterized Zn-binding protein involved in type VI secretion
MPPAARVTDMHVCPMVTGIVPHVGGPILPPCEPTVLIGFLPAARITDMLTCVGPPDIIVMGSPTVLIGDLMAARIGDPTAHGGVIVLGCFTVIIGEAGAPPPIVAAVNPTDSVINCGNIIDAFISRLTGADPNATAPNQMDGTFDEIEQRHNVKLQWNKNFNDAFDAVKAGGNGTIAIVGIDYSGGTASHVVVMANAHGQPVILEGQNWGPGNPKETITSPDRANARYNSDGGSNIGYGIVRQGDGGK